jgi:hypothetical protein
MAPPILEPTKSTSGTTEATAMEVSARALKIATNANSNKRVIALAQICIAA